MRVLLAATLFGFLGLVAVLFQLALAAGTPWGELAMGGRYPGRFPPALRFAALLQAGILGVLGLIVWVRAGIILPEWLPVSQKAIWGVVAFCALSLIANLITPSRRERMIWAPVAAILLLSSILVALG